MTPPRPRRSSALPAELSDPVRHDGLHLPDVEADRFAEEIDGLTLVAAHAFRAMRDPSLMLRPGDTVDSASARIGACPVVLAGLLLTRGREDVLKRLRANEEGTK